MAGLFRLSVLRVFLKKEELRGNPAQYRDSTLIRCASNPHSRATE